jgi:coproporphyrinogen III oxidase-like Fe-S oxidoreductase
VGADKLATRRHRAPETWLTAVERQGHGMQEQIALNAAERAEEMLMMGLRLAEGVGRARFRAETGIEIEAALDSGRLADLIAGGFLVQDAQGLRATAAGRQRLNAVLAALAA